ncbi:MAG: hypothetical protein COY70_00585 [Candidatus Magasanikbacteria bacterium CG_4_10_14_0_8_um_filter_42_12]|nr:MAG: hypothetical protein COY70_00585 [Candidatus Magasanikbacteria bacterium CG_4_10_14_0_8_um_filter_42_12]
MTTAIWGEDAEGHEAFDAMEDDNDYQRASEQAWTIWSGYNAMKDLTFLLGVQITEPPMEGDAGDLEGWIMLAKSKIPDEDHFRRLCDYAGSDELHWAYVQDELEARTTSADEDLHGGSTHLVEVFEDPYENWDLEHPPHH